MSSPRVLLIEDEPGIADSVIYALKTEGIFVTWHNTIADGIDAFNQAPHDLVILDVGLPDGSGFECCQRLRLHPSHGMVPIIFLTARSDEVDRVLGLELGADDYVCKPFSPRELSSRVRAHLRRIPGGQFQPATNEHLVRVSQFRMDERRCEIHYQSQLLPLSAQQYRVLRALVMEPGKVFSREALIRASEADPELCEPRTVDSHIRDLRSLLRPLGGDRAIKTHRGLGYSLSVDP